MYRLSLTKALFIIFVAMCFVTIVYIVFDIENTEVEDAWNVNKTRNVSVYIVHNEETSLRLPKEFCEREIFLLVIIYSAPEDFATRKTIRETWASQKQIFNMLIEFYFLIGRTNDFAVQDLLENEYSTYDDLIQEDFVENYYNLSLKSLYMMKTVGRHCLGKTEYLLKIDGDMYLNTENLVKTLMDIDGNNLILGYLFDHVQPIRSKRSKWYAPYYLYSQDYYPPFVSGTGYVMSIDMVPKLFNASFSAPLFHLEDVYVTGLLSKDIGVTPRDNSFFTHQKIRFAPCVYMNLITSHGYTDVELAKLYKKVNESNLKELCANRCRYTLYTNCFD